MNHPRLVFIGIDSMDQGILRQLGAEGRFPALTSLFERSAVSVGRSPTGLGNDATWSVFNSGVNPGCTGRYFVRQVLPGDYISTYLTADHVNAQPYWKWLSDAGRRVAVVDAPYAKVEPLNGIQTADWLVHSPLYHHEATTYPAALVDELASEYGLDPVKHSDAPGRRSPSELRRLADGLLHKTRRKSEYAQRLLADAQWDHVSVTLTDAHCAGHQFWHLHDAHYADFDAGARDDVGDLMLEIYDETDRQVGEMLALTGPDDHIVTFTGPGMGPNHTASHVLDAVLRALDPSGRQRSLMNPVRSTYRSVMPKSLRKRLRTRADHFDEVTQRSSRRHRAFYSVPSNELAGAIRLNLVGRDPDGVLEPGAEVDRTIGRLTEDLLALRNIDTGAPIVEQVVRADQLFSGPYVDWLPDVLVVWTQDALVRGVTSPRTGDVWQDYPGSRTGDHTPFALASVAGPGIEPSWSDEFDARAYAPTMTALLGVDVPAFVEGRTLVES